MLVFLAFFNTSIPCIAPDALFFAMQSLIRLRDIVNIGSVGRNAVDQTQSIINTNVQLHAEMPVIAFLCLMHSGVPLTGFIFGRGRCRYNTGINDTAFT